MNPDLLARVAHDLKSPLTAARVLADMMLEDADGMFRQDLLDLVEAVDLAAAHADGLGLLVGVGSGGSREALGTVVDGVLTRVAFKQVRLRGRSERAVAIGAVSRALTAVLLNGVSLGHDVTVELFDDGFDVDHGGALSEADLADLLHEEGAERLRARGHRTAALGLWGARNALCAAGASVGLEVVASGWRLRARWVSDAG